MGPALLVRRISVHPASVVMVADEGVTAIEVMRTSLVASPVSLVIVRVAPVVVAEAAERNAGVMPAAVAEDAARKAIWACAGAARKSASTIASACSRGFSHARPRGYLNTATGTSPRYIYSAMTAPDGLLSPFFILEHPRQTACALNGTDN